MVDHAKTATDAAAYTAAIASLCGLLQPIAAFVASALSIWWLSVQLRDYYRKKKGSSN